MSSSESSAEPGEAPERSLPNIVVCGTPGTGKTTTAGLLEERLSGVGNFKLLSVGPLVKEHGLHSGYDSAWDTYEVDDDKVLDYLEPLCAVGGCIIDWHECGILPESWIDLVVVLRCDHSKLWDRLEARGYALAKIQENNEAEIMQVVLDDARDSFPKEIVIELQSETVDQMEENVDRLCAWVDAWKRDNAS
ncbi:factor activating pos9 [Savitreella phatthalungensis]